MWFSFYVVVQYCEEKQLHYYHIFQAIDTVSTMSHRETESSPVEESSGELDVQLFRAAESNDWSRCRELLVAHPGINPMLGSGGVSNSTAFHWAVIEDQREI